MADKQRREYVIHPDGTVDEHVINVKGPSCERKTRETEKRLGEVIHREYTREYAEVPSPTPAPPAGAAAKVQEQERQTEG